MARWGRARGPGRVADAAIGAASGLMSAALKRIRRAGSEETRRREREAQAGMPPATIRAAEAAAAAMGQRIPDERKGLAGHLVYGVATDAAWRLGRAALR